MTIALYMKDCYLREFEARVVKIKDNSVVLDQTAFYPRGGGLEHDTGKILWNNKEYNVIKVVKDENGEILHILDKNPDFQEGAVVRGIINWEKRYRMMRLHTAAHIIAAILYNKYGAMMTGGHITPEYAKGDFNITNENWREIFEETVKKVNEIVKKGIDIKIYFLPREEALKIPGIVKLANRLPPNVKELRIVEIPGVDIQADGGPHVANTKEIGTIKILKMESRGKGRKRLYYTVEP